MLLPNPNTQPVTKQGPMEPWLDCSLGAVCLWLGISMSLSLAPTAASLCNQNGTHAVSLSLNATSSRKPPLISSYSFPKHFLSVCTQGLLGSALLLPSSGLCGWLLFYSCVFGITYHTHATHKHTNTCTHMHSHTPFNR